MNRKFPDQSQLSEEDLQCIIGIAPVGMIVSDVDGKFIYVNPALMDLLGYDENEIYQADLIITSPEDRNVSQQIRQRLLKGLDQSVVMEKRYLHKSGRSILCLVSIVGIRNQHNQIDRFVAQIIDIEYRKKMEKSADLFRSIINASRDAMYIIEPSTGKFLDVNLHSCEVLGYGYEEMLKMHISDIEASLDTDEKWKGHVSEMREQKYQLLTSEHRSKDGKVFPVEVSVSYLVQDNFEYLLAIVRDITERKKSEAVIWRQANYDVLTGLPNRNMLYDRLQQSILSSYKIAVLCLDLDKFKEVNDTLGHDVGDKLLKEASRRINSCVREADTVARLGGDEFCVVIDNVDERFHVDRIAHSILKALEEPFLLGINKIFVSVSIGISFFPNDGDNVDDLLKKSDQAMYFAKNKGRNCFQYFTESMHKKALDRMHLSRDIHDALQNQQFYLEYQPIVSLKDESIYKAEALLRWGHPGRGLVSSAEFIEVSEENGTIIRIGEYVFNQVIDTVKEWRSTINECFQISINASPLQFREGSQQLELWVNNLKANQVLGDAVLVEITEGLIMDTDRSVMDKLLMLRDAGIQVALDDFGTGYSSLAYLQKLDIDYLKIDKSFVDNLGAGSNEEALCEAIIVMAHRLNLKVVAEGIETNMQYDFLKKAGCDYGQGYLFSPALNKKEFERWVKNTG